MDEKWVQSHREDYEQAALDLKAQISIFLKSDRYQDEGWKPKVDDLFILVAIELHRCEMGALVDQLVSFGLIDKVVFYKNAATAMRNMVKAYKAKLEESK
jgi:hypothetical protein